MTTFRVVSLWNGERTVEAWDLDENSARAAVEEIQRDGWPAWMEAE